MAPQRKPAQMQERKGAFRHDPKRRRVDIPGDGSAPLEPPVGMNLDEYETQAWRDIVSLTPEGVGKANDTLTIEAGARLLGKIRRTKEFTAAEIAQLRVFLNGMGQSPAGRAALALPAEKPKDNPAAEFKIEKIRERKYLGSTPNAN